MIVKTENPFIQIIDNFIIVFQNQSSRSIIWENKLTIFFIDNL